MQVVGHLHGGAPLLKRYQLGAESSTPGEPWLVSVTAEAGLNLASTTALNDMVGISKDVATYSTTQGTGLSSAEALATFDIRPDAIYKIRLSDGATAGTAMTIYTETVASAGGTAITGGNFSGTTFVDGQIWGYSGANVGQHRKITSVSTTVATVLIPFDYATVVGDEYLATRMSLADENTVTLTSNLKEIDNSKATAENTAELRCIDVLLRDVSADGRNNSFGLFVSFDHFLLSALA